MLEMMLGNTLAAAALAVIVVIVCRTLRPSPAARHALWLVVVVKLVSPIGFMWSFPLPFERPNLFDVPNNGIANQVSVLPKATDEPIWVLVASPDSTPTELPTQVDPSAESLAAIGDATRISDDYPVEPVRSGQSLYLWVAIVWLAGAIVVAGRFVRRTARFSRYASSGKQASPSLIRQVAELAATLRVRAPEVRILADLPSPVVWCLFRPVLLWPKGLQDQLSAGGRQAVLVHELAHLRRRDHWVRWLELAANVIYWWNPLFWLARRQMRFHAELACDAWVTGTLPGTRRDYAEALLEVCARSSRAAAPSPAVGVGGDGRRDFQRRLTMIMREQVPCRLAAGVKLFVVLLLTAALPAWTLGQTKPEPKVEEDKGLKIEVNGIEFTPDVELFKIFAAEVDVDADKKVKELESKIAELKKQLEAVKAKAGAKAPQVRWTIVNEANPHPKPPQPVVPGQPLKAEVRWMTETPAPTKYKVIGADGKEIQGAKVLIIRDYMQPAKVAQPPILARTVEPVNVMKPMAFAVRTYDGGNVINLTRATYALSKEKAAPLAAFLKENVKTSVLEIKVEDKGITVTTTPETQAAIRSLVKLMGHGESQPMLKLRIGNE